MQKAKEQAFPILIQRDEHGQYYVQKTFNDNFEMEEWLQKFTNQRLQINNLKCDLQRAEKEIHKLTRPSYINKLCAIENEILCKEIKKFIEENCYRQFDDRYVERFDYVVSANSLYKFLDQLKNKRTTTVSDKEKANEILIN